MNIAHILKFLGWIVIWHLCLFSAVNVHAHTDPSDDPVNISKHFWLKKSVKENPGTDLTSFSAIIFTDGTLVETKDYITSFPSKNAAFYKELNIETSAALLLNKNVPSKLFLTASEETLVNYGNYLGNLLSDTGLNGCVISESENLSKTRHDAFIRGLGKSGLHILPEKNLINQFYPDMEDPDKPKKQFLSYKSENNFYFHQLHDSAAWLTDWLNNDFLIIDESQLNSLDFFSDRIAKNKWYRKIALQKDEKNKKWQSSLKNKKASKAPLSWNRIQFQLNKESLVLLKNDDNIPFPELDKKFVFIHNGDREMLFKSMSRYAVINELKWNQFDEEPELILTEIANAEQVIISLRSIKDLAQINQLIEGDVKLTILVKDPELLEATYPFGSVLYQGGLTALHEDLIGQILFGGLGAGGYNPYQSDDLTKAQPAIITKGGYRVSYLTPGLKNMDQSILQKINPIIEESIKEGAFPGCQIAIIKDNSLIYEKAFGYFTYDSIKEVTTSNLYDLASITKVAGTLQAVMFLQEQGIISLDEKLSTYLPELNKSNKKDLTIRNVLLHEAGLKPYLPFWKVTIGKDLLNHYVYESENDSINNIKSFGLYYPTEEQKQSVWKELIASDLRQQKDGDTTYNYRYSDLGFMLLQMLVEKVSNQPLDEFLRQNIYLPLGLQHMVFNPLTKFRKEEIIPTEYDYYFRNAQVWGTVHDQNAQVLGGVAGHAGLFSNAHDLSKLMQMNLNGGSYGDYKFLHKKTLDYFTAKQKDDNRRGLGWDKPDIKDENTPLSASSKTYGHTGFTGTAVWTDPEHNIIYVFLSNRVYPSAENRKLMENNIRIKIQNVIYEAMTSGL